MKSENSGKKIIKKIRNHIVMLPAGAAAGLLLLLAVYCLPVEPMKEHVYQSLPLLEREFETDNLIEEYPGSFMGGFTDYLMLENAIYQSEEHSVLDQVLNMYRGESGTGDGWATGYSLVDYLEGKPQPREESYARYWHGYLTVLKPLLFLTNFTSIRMIAAILQLILTGMILVTCGRKREDFLGTAFLVSIPFLYYFSLFASLSLSICFYLLAAVMLVQLKWDRQFRAGGWYGEFFLAAGMLTSYFDFLTYPLVTLGFPLCVYLYLNRESWKRELMHIAAYSAEWGIGYIGFWAMKWILADILTGSGTISDGLRTILERTQTAGEASKAAGFAEVIKMNGSVYGNRAFGLLAAGILIWLAGRSYKRRKAICRDSIIHAGLILLPALYPFVWFFCTQNHSQEHWIFTCKIFSVTVFAGICAAGRLCRD